MKALNDLISEAKLSGYKDKINLNQMKDNYEQYQNLFLSMSEVMNDINNDSEGSIPLTKSEIDIYHSQIEQNEIFESLCNDKNILYLSEEMLNQEIEELTSEIEKIDKETIRMSSLCKNEQEENEKLQREMNSISNTEQKFLSEQLCKLKEDFLSKINNKCKALNKSIVSIISELDYNIKRCNSSSIQKFIIGYRKMNNEKFDTIFNKLVELLNEYLQWFNSEISSSLNSKENLVDVNALAFLYEKIAKISNAEVELKKNILLKRIKLSKEQYKNKIINDYIVDNSILNKENETVISSYDLEKLIERSFDNEKEKIKYKYTNIKNKYNYEIYNNLLLKNKQSEITFIENFTKLENVINSIYPYLLCDLNVTQEIYDQISEIIEIYTKNQNKISIQQAKLRKMYNESESPINKITIDDRDFVLLDIGRMMIKENKRNTKVKIYELKEVIANALNFLQLSNDNKVLKQFFEEVFDNSQLQMKMLNEMNKKESIIPKVKKYKNCLVDYEEEFIEIINEFNTKINSVHIQGKNKNYISLYQAVFLYLFHKDIYKKEISDLYSIPTAPRFVKSCRRRNPARLLEKRAENRPGAKLNCPGADTVFE